MILYTVYSVLLILSFRKITEKSYFDKNAILKTIVISFCFGTVLELLQSLIPGRNFDIFDMLANVGGTIIGIGLIKLFSKFQPVS